MPELDLEPIKARLAEVGDGSYETVEVEGFKSRARADVPALIAEVERLREENIELHKTIKFLHSEIANFIYPPTIEEEFE